MEYWRLPLSIFWCLLAAGLGFAAFIAIVTCSFDVAEFIGDWIQKQRRRIKND